jgi:hypothetical protein
VKVFIRINHDHLISQNSSDPFLDTVWSQPVKEIDDEYPFPFRKSSGKTREEHHAAQMRKLLSQIPCYAVQARRRLETGGQEGEMHYWLALYQEFNHRPTRSITASQAPPWILMAPASPSESRFIG